MPEPLCRVKANVLKVQQEAFEALQTIYKNNMEIARITDGDQSLRAQARAEAFKEASYAIKKLDFIGKPLKAVDLTYLCNGDYWHKSGCGNRVTIEGCYCEDCTRILRDNKGLWPGQEHR